MKNMEIIIEAAAQLESLTNDEDYEHILDVKCAYVDGDKIKVDTFYMLVNGEFEEED